MRRRRFLGAVGAASVGLAGCSGNDGTQTTSPPDDETTTAAPGETPTTAGGETATDDETTDGETEETETDGTETEETTTEEELTNLSPIGWDDEDDWDLSETEHNVVHARWAPAGNEHIRLGYPAYDQGGRNLVAYWPMYGSDNRMEDVAYGNDGTHHDVISVDGGPFGKPGKRYNAGASSTVPDGQFSVREQLTLNVWFLLRSETGSSPVFFLNDGLDVTAQDDGQLRVDIASGGNTYSLHVPRNRWSTKQLHMLTVVFTGERLYAYIDATQAPDIIARLRDPIDRRDRALAPLQNTDTGKISRGDAFDVRLYDRALDEDEIEALYDAAFEGSLTTASKSFDEPAKPHLQQLEYELNGGSIELAVTGSPGADSEETVTVDLDGATGYAPTWERAHEEFWVTVTLRSDTGTDSPTFHRVVLDQ